MSIEYAELLLERAKRYMHSAKRNFEEKLYDVSALEAEIATQLALKAIIAKCGFHIPRTHRIRQLISFIIENELLPKDLTKKLSELIMRYRSQFIVLERAREVSQYGATLIDNDEAEIALNIAKKLVSLIEELWSLAK